MDCNQDWLHEREGFRKWLASRDLNELFDISNDISKRLDYESQRLDDLKTFRLMIDNL